MRIEELEKQNEENQGYLSQKEELQNENCKLLEEIKALNQIIENKERADSLLEKDKIKDENCELQEKVNALQEEVEDLNSKNSRESISLFTVLSYCTVLPK